MWNRFPSLTMSVWSYACAAGNSCARGEKRQSSHVRPLVGHSALTLVAEPHQGPAAKQWQRKRAWKGSTARMKILAKHLKNGDCGQQQKCSHAKTWRRSSVDHGCLRYWMGKPGMPVNISLWRNYRNQVAKMRYGAFLRPGFPRRSPTIRWAKRLELCSP